MQAYTVSVSSMYSKVLSHCAMYEKYDTEKPMGIHHWHSPHPYHAETNGNPHGNSHNHGILVSLRVSVGVAAFHRDFAVQHSDLQWMCCDIFGGWSATHTHRRNLVGPQRADHRQRWRSVVEHRSFQRERPTWAAWCQRTRWSHRDLAAPTSVCQRPAAIRQRPEASARTCRGHVRLPSAAASAETGGVAVSLPTEHLLLLFLCPSAQMETLAIDQPHLLVLSLTRTTQFHMSTLPNRNRQQKHAI